MTPSVQRSLNPIVIIFQSFDWKIKMLIGLFVIISGPEYFSKNKKNNVKINCGVRFNKYTGQSQLLLLEN